MTTLETYVGQALVNENYELRDSIHAVKSIVLPYLPALVALNNNYLFDDDGELYRVYDSTTIVPVKHPDISTLASILPERFGTLLIKEQLIPILTWEDIDYYSLQSFHLFNKEGYGFTNEDERVNFGLAFMLWRIATGHPDYELSALILHTDMSDVLLMSLSNVYAYIIVPVFLGLNQYCSFAEICINSSGYSSGYLYAPGNDSVSTFDGSGDAADFLYSGAGINSKLVLVFFAISSPFLNGTKLWSGNVYRVPLTSVCGNTGTLIPLEDIVGTTTFSYPVIANLRFPAFMDYYDSNYAVPTEWANITGRILSCQLINSTTSVPAYIERKPDYNSVYINPLQHIEDPQYALVKYVDEDLSATESY